MLEIDKDYFCSACFYINDPASNNQCQGRQPCSDICKRHHRKHPTPDEFRMEYGHEVPPNMPVWVNYDIGLNDTDWLLTTYAGIFTDNKKTHFFGAKYVQKVNAIVVACTPWGKPPVGWKQE